MADPSPAQLAAWARLWALLLHDEPRNGNAPLVRTGEASECRRALRKAVFVEIGVWSMNHGRPDLALAADQAIRREGLRDA
jgi:hypothetical protein